MSPKRRPAPEAQPSGGRARETGARPATAGETTATLVPPAAPAYPAGPPPLRPLDPTPANARAATPSPATNAGNGQAPRRAASSRQLRKAAKAERREVAAAAAPVPVKGRKSSRRGRRVHRIVRRIDLWSVLKLALVLYTCVYAAVLMATAGLWAFLNSAGLVDKFENFMKDVGFDNWQFHGAPMFKGVAAAGAILVLALSVLTLVFAGLVNVVSELTGGIRITVIEEEPSSGYRRKVNPTLAEWEAGQRNDGPPPAPKAAGGNGGASATRHPAGT